ncbi:polyamine ABC transporter substrate-binding protein [Microbaculum marinisediminis]|uniref:Putrescine-binding periplasmic protein n=1 Tax=Microbaculum marinisediminis TaxID=2931392 RepID=A0AAW5QUC7_9HYPH|nr:polyamine ABC transporter substrate-binding protein [Microbaculum sp. A6E488]MCT8970499.1 polyamine ABC transporter substrate-binding protein [Microbaculum sp. A6E488]
MIVNRIATALAVSAAMTVAATAQDKVVHVYNWSDYIGEDVLDEFTEETGIKVVYDVFDSNDILETKLLAGSTGYDVVVPSGTFLARQIQAGVFQPLDKSKLPNITHQWDAIAERIAKFDPGNEHAVNYMWGTTGIGYNVGMIEERMPDAPVDSWAMIFDPEVVSKFADCGIHMLDAADEMIPAALNYLGKDPDSKDPAEIEEAAKLIETIRPHVQKFHSSEYIEALANGNICLAVGWSGDILQSRDRAAEADTGIEIAYAIPKEGAMMWFDNLAIPADAPHPEEALAFINFMMKPEIAAENSNYIYYANGNKDSQPLLEEDVIGDTAIYPDEETVGRLYTTTPYDPKVQRVVTRAWTRIKSGT